MAADGYPLGRVNLAAPLLEAPSHDLALKVPLRAPQAMGFDDPKTLLTCGPARRAELQTSLWRREAVVAGRGWVAADRLAA